MGLGIIIPLVVLPIAIFAGFIWYRRSIAQMKSTESQPVSGVRLTAEALHRLASPPWRIVYEINTALGGIDHVAIGPPGVIAITTVVADRPDVQHLLETRGEARLVGEAAIVRGPVDELLRSVGMSCRLSSRIFWGTPDPDRAAFDRIVHASHLVEGQRVADWLALLEDEGDRDGTTLDQPHIDRAWRAVLMGIGRPDPLP